ncbi:MAG: adenylate/guanylate cyclase domain-containing protein [Pseudomonadota bacterium]|nr:adenylate/guanylate cyclase domain-containing protein [Pseudomonadota bacterium]
MEAGSSGAPDPHPAYGSLAPVGEWLLAEGRFLPRLEDVFGGLVDQVQATGLPLLRCGLHVAILHPQLVALSVHWWQGRGVSVVERRRYAGWENAGYLDSPLAVVSAGLGTVRRRLVGTNAPGDFPILAELAESGGTDYYVMPLIFGDRAVGAALSWCTDRPGGFADRDLAALDAIGPLLATLCELRVLRGLASTILDTYIGRTAGQRVLAGTIVRGSGERLDAVVWYCDLRGFTARAEAGPPESVIALLNAYFETMAGAVQRHGGEVLKFIGDGMLAIFPITSGASAEAACHRALLAARTARDEMSALDREVQANGGAPVGYGIALHVGEVTYGNIGAPDRLDFTVIGPAVNQAARVEGLCQALGQPVLTTTAVAQHAGDGVEPLGRFLLRGIEEPQQLWGLSPASSRP